MSLPAFWLPDVEWRPDCALSGEEARHCFALRLKQDDEIMLLNGFGRCAKCRIVKMEKKRVLLELGEQWEAPKPESRPIIAIALSKAARRGFFLEKAAELGAWEVWLWQAARSQGQISDKLIASCQRELRAGAKQCRNPWFPTMRQIGGASALAEASAQCQWKLLPWEERARERIASASLLGLPNETVYAIGPEGGITAPEAESLIASGFVTISLGSRVLRCETAATFCLSLHWWASQRKEAAE